jgi:hypothetical protein
MKQEELLWLQHQIEINVDNQLTQFGHISNLDSPYHQLS